MIWEKPQLEEYKEYAKRSVWSDDEQQYVLVDTDIVVEEVTRKIPYTVAIDTSGMGSDKNQVVVINNITKKMAARYEKKNIAEEHLAMLAVEIAQMYHDALIAPEVNYSHEICNYILKLGYKNMYITENITRQDNKIMGGISYGFRTTTATKPAIISALRSRLTANPNLIEDRGFWEEAEYYIITDVAKNIMNAAPGKHDDVVMATAIANYVSDSFQSKQSAMVVKEKVANPMIYDVMRKKKKTVIRKGLYTNHA